LRQLGYNTTRNSCVAQKSPTHADDAAVCHGFGSEEMMRMDATAAVEGFGCTDCDCEVGVTTLLRRRFAIGIPVFRRSILLEVDRRSLLYGVYYRGTTRYWIDATCTAQHRRTFPTNPNLTSVNKKSGMDRTHALHEPHNVILAPTFPQQ
jgi:hypothetical protein